MSAPARYITQPTPGRANLLEPARKIAAALSFNLMPWQEQVIGTLTERNPDGTPAYTDATIGTPRQAGKTTTVEILMLLEALSGPNRSIAYTTTTGGAARAMLMDNLVPALRASAFDGLFSVRATNGSERVLFNNHSSISILSSAKHAGHGSTLHAVFCDELWNAEDWLEQIRPTLITTGGVWWGFSTAGTPADSEYLLGRCERGREDVEAGVTSGRFYAEWSILPDEIDDVEAYVRINPAVGFTVKAQDIRDAVKGMDKSEAARAYGNIFTTSLHDPIISIETWNALEENTSSIVGDLVLSVDVSPARTHASIAAAGKNADGRWHVEVIDSRDGTAWIPQRLADLVKIHHPKAIYADSQAESIIPDLERIIGVDIRMLSTAAHAAAHAFLIEQVNDDNLRHPTDSELVAALTAADVRPLQDGGQAWSRRKSNVTITPIVAVTIALHGAHLLQGSVGLWQLDNVVNEQRPTRWDPTQMRDLHLLLDSRPPEQWFGMLTRRGWNEATAQDIIAYMLHGVLPDTPPNAAVIPPPRAWSEWAHHTMQPEEEAPRLQAVTTAASPIEDDDQWLI